MAGEKLSSGANNLETALALANNKEEVRYTAEKMIVAYKPPKATEDYQKKFDPAKGIVVRPTNTVIVAQDPAADQVVPAGTEVKVTLISKGSLPVGSFQVSTAVQGKYGAGDVDLILKDLDDKGQAVTPIFETEKPYEALSAAEKAAFGQYASGIGLAFGNDADAKGAFEDLQLFHNL
jgi:hypothetical protein